MNWLDILLAVVSGGTLQYIISSRLMPKKDKREADAHFIDTLLKRIDLLETKVDNQTIVIKDLIRENEAFKAEIKYLTQK